MWTGGGWRLGNSCTGFSLVVLRAYLGFRSRYKVTDVLQAYLPIIAHIDKKVNITYNATDENTSYFNIS